METQIFPYKGLEPFREEDAMFFFGRTKETEDVEAFLSAYPLTILFGPSGAGKSSLLQAGVLRRARERSRKTIPGTDITNDPHVRTPPFLVSYIRSWCGDPISTVCDEINASLQRALSFAEEETYSKSL